MKVKNILKILCAVLVCCVFLSGTTFAGVAGSVSQVIDADKIISQFHTGGGACVGYLKSDKTCDSSGSGGSGSSAYVYIAYASDASGTGFTTTFSNTLNYIAVKATTSPISNPQASDFSGLWFNYKGATGSTGSTGSTGAAGNPGSIWWNGSGAPGTISGSVNGDYYLNTANGDIYKKVSGSWGSPVGNIKGTAGNNGNPGTAGSNGVSILWQGSLASAPSNPTLNWAYRNTVTGIASVWDGSAWQEIVHDGTGGGSGCSSVGCSYSAADWLTYLGIAAQIQADWNQSNNALLDYIKNKPTLFSGSYTDLTNKPSLFSGSYTDLTNKPTIPAAQIQGDWNQSNNALLDYIKNKPTLFSGSYTDLTNKPSLFSGSYLDLTNNPFASIGNSKAVCTDSSGNPIACVGQAFGDSYPLIYNVADPTKLVQFDAPLISPNTKRTFSFPDKNGIFALTSDLPAVADTNPVMDSTAAQGSSAKYARQDHVHPSDTTKADDSQFTITGSGLTAGRSYYLAASTGTLTEADATSSSTLPNPAICVATSTTICRRIGKWTTTGLTAGALYYVPVGGGAISTAKPTASGNQQQAIGQASSTTVLEIWANRMVIGF